MHFSDRVDLSRGLLGGLVIGLSSTAFLFLNKRISGMSGIIRRVITESPVLWASSYVAGLLASGAILSAYSPASFGDGKIVLTETGYLVAGVFVGFGTSLANGCTSGHGVCGLGRQSARSFVAVCTFMASGIVSAVALRGHTFFYQAVTLHSAPHPSVVPAAAAFVGLTCCFSMLPRVAAYLLDVTSGVPVAAVAETASNAATAFGSALLFGIGLGVSGMTDPAKVSGFLDPLQGRGWDPSLMGVMGGAVLLNLVTFSGVAKQSKEHAAAVALRPAFTVDWKLLLGSALFGFGWGVGGVCPGPAIVGLGAGQAASLRFVPYLLLGVGAHEAIFSPNFKFTLKKGHKQ